MEHSSYIKSLGRLRSLGHVKVVFRGQRTTIYLEIVIPAALILSAILWIAAR